MYGRWSHHSGLFGAHGRMVCGLSRACPVFGRFSFRTGDSADPSAGITGRAVRGCWSVHRRSGLAERLAGGLRGNDELRFGVTIRDDNPR